LNLAILNPYVKYNSVIVDKLKIKKKKVKMQTKNQNYSKFLNFYFFFFILYKKSPAHLSTRLAPHHAHALRYGAC